MIAAMVVPFRCDFLGGDLDLRSHRSQALAEPKNRKLR